MADPMMVRLLRPRVILPVVLLALFAVAVLAPRGGGYDDATRLTTWSVEGRGARGIYETLDKLGWDVSRKETPFDTSIATEAIYAVMDPAIDLRSSEVKVLLDKVRAGASLLAIFSARSALLDSLGISLRSSQLAVANRDSALYGRIPAAEGCRVRTAMIPSGLDIVSQAFVIPDSVATELEEFASAVTGAGRKLLLAAGFRYGEGRIVLLTAPQALRNDIIRQCARKEGVLAVRMIEWLSGDTLRPVIFDEYHHGYGEHRDMITAVADLIRERPGGRFLLHVAAAGLVLIFAASVRAVPPRARERIERRSPLEHVGALARAYTQVGATRRSTRMLIRGLRRRQQRMRWMRGTDEEFLAFLRDRYPELRQWVELLEVSATRKVSTEEFMKVAEGIAHIERYLTSEYD